MPPIVDRERSKDDEIQSRSLANASGGNSREENLDTEVDELQQKLGGYGRYQIVIYALLGLVYMRGSWHALVPIFQGLVPNYHCNPYPGLSLNESDPPGDDCHQYKYVNHTRTNETQSCSNGWNITWDEKDLTSIVSEYILVCDREYLVELSTTLYMVGTTCGVIFLSPLSERIGAKTVMLACLWLQIIVGVAVPWSGSITILIVLKFFIGLFNMTIALCLAIMMSETFDAAHRELPVLGIQFFWSIGIMSLSLMAYLLPDWKQLQLTISIPINVLTIFYTWLIPQSLPWLLSKGKLKKAERVIKRFLAINSLPSIPNLKETLAKFDSRGKTDSSADSVPTVRATEESQLHSNAILVQNLQPADDLPEAVTKPTYFVLDLFKYRSLRIYTIILCYLFLVNALSYFGIIYNTPNLDGNRYLNLFILGLVEIPAYTCSILSNRYLGRRRSIMMFLFICSATNIPIPFIPDKTACGTDLTELRTVLVMIGKFGITGSYSAIYLYASEVFPTVIRNQAVGFCSFFENVGSIAAPNMLYISKKMTNLPLTIYGIMTIIGAILIFFLPETHNVPLPQTIEDTESRGRGRKRQRGRNN